MMKNMHGLNALLFCCLLLVSCQSVSVNINSKVVTPKIVSEQTTTKISQIEKVVKEHMEANDIPALVVGIIQENEVQAFINAGTMTRNDQTPVNEQTVFQLGSLSKTFTGIMANHLIENGKLEVMASITDYLPNTLSEATKAKLRPITVQDLLHHTAGFPRDAVYAKRPFKWLDGPMVGGYNETQLLKDLEELELIHSPGSKWEYSNLGYGLLGYILEGVSGQSLQDLFATNFNEGYGLSRTTMDLEKAKKMQMPTPYKPSMRKFKTAPWEMGYLRAGGGVCSTVEDLSDLLVQQMKAYQAYDLNESIDPLVLTEKKVSWFGNEGYPYYGNGMMVFSKPRDSTLIHYVHGGDVDGFGSSYLFFPNQQMGLVMLTSSGGQWFIQLEWAIQDILLEKEPRKAIDMDKKELVAFTGTYEFNDGKTFDIQSSENGLIATLPHVGEQPISAYASNKFFFSDIPGELIFETNGMRYIDQFGNHFLGKKVKQLTQVE